MSAIALLGLSACYGVVSEDLETPQEEATVQDDVFDIPAVQPADPEIPATPAGAVGELLVRLQIQPTAWGTEHTFARQDAGREPYVSLYRDGTLIWRAPDGLRIAQLGRERAASIHEALLERGLGTIPSYVETSRPSEGAMCMGREGPTPCKPGGRLTMADVGIEIWDIAMPGSGLQRERHFAGWAPGRDADLRAVRAEVQAAIEAAGPDSRAFQPQAASLLLLSTDWNADAESWPLRPELFDAAVHNHEVVVELDGTELETMRSIMPGYRRTHFVREGHLIEATLIPWLPDQDWSEDIEGFAPQDQ